MDLAHLSPLTNQLRKLKRALRRTTYLRYPHNRGFCPICERRVLFFKESAWLRDSYKCSDCHSIPRNRALANALNRFYPHWRESTIHESSPGGPLSEFLKKSCSNYSCSHCYDNVPRGAYFNGFRSEDLSAMTFADESLDMFVTSDVFEHVLEPVSAFKEIARVLRPGGAHIFTMPWYGQIDQSVQRAAVENGKIIHLLEPMYHGNPISEEGSLVTYDWGKDFCDVIFMASRMTTTIYLERNVDLGLDAEFLEVFVSRKAPRTAT
jgi:SAM-dependent methyltransferase